MNFLADEGVDKSIVERLRNDGHKVQYILESDSSVSDDEVIQLANKTSALLLTTDKDFGELFFRQRSIIEGVILIRLAGLSQQSKAEIVATTIQKHAEELPRNFTVITPGTVRIRKQYLY